MTSVAARRLLLPTGTPPQCSNLSEYTAYILGLSQVAVLQRDHVSNSTLWTSRRLNPNLHTRTPKGKKLCVDPTVSFAKRKAAFILPVASLQRGAGCMTSDIPAQYDDFALSWDQRHVVRGSSTFMMPLTIHSWLYRIQSMAHSSCPVKLYLVRS